MNQKPSFSRSKESKREKTVKSKRDEEERGHCDESTARRNSSERPQTSVTNSSSYSRYRDATILEKRVPNIRDGHSLVFRRQVRYKYLPVYQRGTAAEGSPGRVPHTDIMKNDAPMRITTGHCNRNVIPRDRDYFSKHGGIGENSVIFHTNRLTSFLQRLLRDDDRERQISMIRLLREIFSQPENSKAIILNLDEIFATFEGLLQLRLHTEFKQEFISTIGLLGSAFGNQAQSLFEWEFGVYNSPTTDEVRVLILKTVHETLKNDKANLTEVMIMLIMSHLQSTLENADLPELLIAIVDAIIEISKSYPNVFSNHFRDIVDILIGWHIDTTQQSSVTEYTSNALISFQQFWISDISFTVTLLGQFLEDMESYAEDAVRIKRQSSASENNLSDVSTESENIAKIKSLIRVLITVLKSLGDMVHPDENGPITWEFVTEMLTNFLKYVMLTAEYFYYPDLLTSANDCVCLLLQLCQSHCADALEHLVSFMKLLQSQTLYGTSEAHLISNLEVMTVFVREVNTHLPVDFVSALFLDNSLSNKLKFSPSPKVQQYLLSLNHAILCVKNVHVIEEFYKCILSDIQASCDVLLDMQDPDGSDDEECKKAEFSLLSSLCALVEIGNAKHSIIGMWALKPSYFHLMTTQLKPTSSVLAVKAPAAQYAVLFTLYSHSQRHNHFISSSSLVNSSYSLNSPTSGPNASNLANVPVMPPPSSGNLSKIFMLLIELLKLPEASYDSKLLGIQWIFEIIDNIQPYLNRLAHHVDFQQLIKVVITAAFMDDYKISKTCGMILLTVLKSSASSYPETLLQSCYEICTLKLSVHDSEIQDLYASLLVFLPLDIVSSGFTLSLAKPDVYRSMTRDGEISVTTIWDMWSTRHGHMNRPSMGNFHCYHFRNIMTFILQGLQPRSKDWLLRLFYSCPPPDKSSRIDKSLSQLVRSSSSMLWFWATWEVAQSCVLSKLRTPLGKPQETFMAIEAAIKDYAKLSKKSENYSEEDSESELLRVHLLLELMEHLEKLMYNAYEGCAVALPTPPKTVRTFFRTNKGTCQEWLSRVRLATLALALQAGKPATALRQGFELIQEMKFNGNTQGSDFEHILIFVVKALIDLHCPEAVLGLYVYCKEQIGRKFTWIKASVDQAAGRFESAAHEYSCILHSASSPPSPYKLHDLVDDNNKSNRNGVSTNHSSCSVNEDLARVLGQLQIKETPCAKLECDPHLRSFLMNQVTECYINLGNWSEAEKWILTQQKMKFSQNGISLKNGFCEQDLSYLKALMTFEEGLRTGSNRTKSDFNEAQIKGLSEEVVDVLGWQVYEKKRSIEKLLLSSAVEFGTKPKPSSLEIKSISDQIKQRKSSILKLMKVSAIEWPMHINPELASLFVSASSISSIFQKGRKSCNIVLQENVKLDSPDYCTSTFALALSWQNVWLCMASKEQGTRPQTGTLLDLLLVTAGLARKQQNFKLCYKLLKNASCLAGVDVSGIQSLLGRSPARLSDAGQLHDIIKTSWDMFPSDKLVKMQREAAKLLHSWGDSEGANNSMLMSSLNITEKLNDQSSTILLNENINSVLLQELNSRSLLSLVKYLQQDSRSLSEFLLKHKVSLLCGDKPGPSFLVNTVSDMEHVVKNVSLLKAENFRGATFFQENVVGGADFVIGRLLRLSVYLCPSLPKAWCAFASWCYRWGRKVVDAASTGCMNLSPDEKSQIIALVPKGSKEDIEVVLNIVSSLHGSSGGEWDEQETDYTENKAEETRRQLLGSCTFLEDVNNCDEVVEKVVDVWKSVVSRTYCYYKMAAEAYLQYLQLSGKVLSKERNEDDNVTATLRLLRLVVKHASELRDVLEHGLAETPTAPWRGIIPQLFSRLSHPEPYVRQSISDLLCRVAQASPHLIVFPAVVGSLTLKAGHQLQEQTSGLLGTYFSEAIEDVHNLDLDAESQTSDQGDLPPSISTILSEEDETEEDTQKTTIMQNCFAALVETLGRQDGRTISEVKNLVHELHRITLLWDELWLGTMNLHHSEVSRRITNLEKEISKVMSNSFLTKEQKKDIIKEKHNVYIKPTLFVLEHLQMITSQPSETPHEQWFQKTFSKQIEDSLNKLKNPIDPSRPQNTWVIYKQLHQFLQQGVQQQQQSKSHLSMDHISPVLASLKNTVIPMPGMNTKVSDIVTIQAVSSVVTILPTKTKPKKLAFMGSDGLKYTYLFKGLEDLHLDERIMQFLSIVNNMFAKTKRNWKEIYNARHYSVTPLGPRSGLIQWVDGATPLFGLYKRWQVRESVASVVKGQNAVSSNLGVTTLRPSEIFYNKLSPLLKEKGVSNLENRKEWPLSVLLDVLKELMEETPKDLLSKELWCSCSSALEWWNVIQTYNHSTAVMSMIGYIIGLGDRHLDNVLIDLSTGEVVHIDYNVCFEKGKNLRVPEKVPFRMTPNIETALGVTGIEGIFRVSSEHVLKVLRKGRETLLTLLEAFVYDPLVDWTPGNEGGYTGAVYGGQQAWAMEAKQTRQNMEMDIALSMFSIRVAEMRGEWLQNKEDLLTSLPKLETCIKEWKTAQIQLQCAENLLQEACQEKALLEEAQSNPNHMLYTLPKRYEETSVVKTKVKAVKDAVLEKLNECKNWQHLHSEALSTVCGAELGKWCADVAPDVLTDHFSVVPVVDFLQSAGQGQLVQQCEHSESELGNILQQQRLTLRSCVELLTTYATIVMQYGATFKEKNRSCKWKTWLENLLNDFTANRCRELIAEFHSEYGLESMDLTSVQAAVTLHFQLQTAVVEAKTTLMNVFERKHVEGLEDPTSLQNFVAEARSAVTCFLSENEASGHYSLLCVVVTALCALNKRLLMMESAAAAAGECLVDLTSWGGDWFLDEIYSMCGNIFQLMSLLHDSLPNDKAEGKAVLHGAHFAHCVFSALEDLSLNFQSIILPEAILTVQAQDQSMIEMMKDLDHIILNCSIPLKRLITDLEANMRNIIMEIKINENKANEVVQKLRNDFESLMKGSKPEISDLTRGQMLLMGFNGLFTKVDADLEILLTFIDNYNQPSAWKNVDIIREAIALTPSVHLQATRATLKDIFFIRKLLAIQKFFYFCNDFAETLRIKGKCNQVERELIIYTDYQLYKPVKKFIAEYVRQMVLGLSSQVVAYVLCFLIDCLGLNVTAEIDLRDIGVENKVSLEELGKKAVEICLNVRISSGKLTQISTLISSFDSAWRKEDLARRLEQNVLILKGSIHRAQLQLARFQWLYEDFLMQGNIGPLQNITAVPHRATIMSEMRKMVQTLISFESAVVIGQERYLSFTASIEQRLKWAAGANPSLTSLQEEFELAISEKTSMVSGANQLSRDLVNVCNSILHFEALRTRTAEALSSESAFLGLINRCQETCLLAESCSSHVSLAEEHLVLLKPLPDNGVTSEWMQSVMEEVVQSLSSCREKLETEKSVTFACWDTLNLEVIRVHDLLSIHHKLMSEVRHILRNLAKHEEQELGAEFKSEGHIYNYIALYKGFSEQISSVVSKLLTDGQEIEVNILDSIEAQISSLCITASEVYTQLLNLAGPVGGGNRESVFDASILNQKPKFGCKLTDKKRIEQSKRSTHNSPTELSGKSSPVSQSVLPKTPLRTCVKKKYVARDPRTGKVMQERNTYATNVWKRVKMKLDGRDPDPNKKSTIAEQVDFVIKEATNLENLAVLYEGWTPWV